MSKCAGTVLYPTCEGPALAAPPMGPNKPIPGAWVQADVAPDRFVFIGATLAADTESAIIPLRWQICGTVISAALVYEGDGDQDSAGALRIGVGAGGLYIKGSVVGDAAPLFGTPDASALTLWSGVVAASPHGGGSGVRLYRRVRRDDTWNFTFKGHLAAAVQLVFAVRLDDPKNPTGS